MPTMKRVNNTLLLNLVEIAFLAGLGGISFVLMKDVCLIGDEASYKDAAFALANYLTGEMAVADFENQFYSRGWFMPGMSVILASVAYFELDLPTFVVYSRALIVSLNIALIWLIMLEFRIRQNSRFAGWVFLILFVSPYALLYMSALWADMLACLLAIYIFLRLSSASFDSWRNVFLCAGALALMIYLRGNYSLLLPVYLFFVIFTTTPPPSKIVRGTFFISCSLLCCMLLIYPWSNAISDRTGISTFTTTSLKLNQIIGIGGENYQRLLDTESDMKNHFFAVDNAVRKAAGQSNVAVEKQYRSELDRSLRSVSGTELASKISTNIGRHLARPSGFLRWFTRVSCEANGTLCKIDVLSGSMVLKFDTVVSYSVMAFIACFMLTPIKAVQFPLLGVAAKGMFFLYMIHPLLSYTHARYLVQFFPVFGLICAVLLANRSRVREIIGFESMTILGCLGNVGQLLAMATVTLYAWLIIFY